MQFRLSTLLYVFALLAAGMGTFGPWLGLLLSGCVISFWLLPNKRPLGSGLLLAAGLVILALLLLPTMGSVRGAARRNSCMNRMKQLTLALHNYQSTHGSFPPAYLTDEHGKPMHSWRVLILPFIEEQAMYNAYEFDEPWDGPNNRKFADKMPDVFRCPGCAACSRVRGNPWMLPGDNCTSYFAVADPRCILRPGKGVSLPEIKDGLSETIMLVEASDRSVNWLQPEDLSLDEASQLLSSPTALRHIDHSETLFSIRYSRGAGVVGIGDAAALFSRPITKENSQALLTAAGGEKIDGYKAFHDAAEPQQLVVYRWGHIFSFAVFVLLSFAPLFRSRPAPEPPDQASSGTAV